MSRRWIWMAFVAVACGKPAPRGADTGTAPAPTAKAGPEANGPLLWEVTPKGGGATLYLYGTVHTGGKDLIPQVAFDKLATTKVFAMEADLESMGMMDLLKRATLPPDQSLDQLVGAADWPKVVEAAKSPMMGEDKLKRFKPWFVAMLLLQKLLDGPPEPVDSILRETAKEKGAEVVFLETISEQLDAIEAALDAKILVEMASDMPKQKQMLEELLAAYKKGDVAEIEKISLDPAQLGDKGLEVMLYQRNRNWIPKLEQLAAGGKPVFVAVGAGHLVGEQGVPALLRARGHTVTRVPAGK
jgi:uncharacterized protein YbaP (TraB family)